MAMRELDVEHVAEQFDDRAVTHIRADVVLLDTHGVADLGNAAIGIDGAERLELAAFTRGLVSEREPFTDFAQFSRLFFDEARENTGEPDLGIVGEQVGAVFSDTCPHLPTLLTS